MTNASDTLKNEDFGNLTVKGMKEISIPKIEVSSRPQTWGWPALAVVLTIIVAIKIRQRIINKRKFGAYRISLSEVSGNGSLLDTYILAKKVYSVKYDRPSDDSFLLTITGRKIRFSNEDQIQVNEYLYSKEDPSFDLQEIRSKLLKWIAREL